MSTLVDFSTRPVMSTFINISTERVNHKPVSGQVLVTVRLPYSTRLYCLMTHIGMSNLPKVNMRLHLSFYACAAV